MKKSAASKPDFDYLAAAAKKAGLTVAGVRAAREWLADQMLAYQHAKLEQGGHTTTNIALHDVFVDLPVSTSSAAGSHHRRWNFLEFLLKNEPIDLSTVLKKGKHIGGAVHAAEDTQDLTAERTELAETEKALGSILLIGGPGQGKSTLGQLACQVHRAGLLAASENELTSQQLELLKNFKTAEGSLIPKLSKIKAGEKGGQVLLPLQVNLPELAAWQPDGNDVAEDDIPLIVRFIADRPGARNSFLSAEYLYKLTVAMPTLLVLDGFDEVGSTHDRSRIVSLARELLTKWSQASAKTLILATTRPQGYADELGKIGVTLHKRYLVPLRHAEALRYAEKLIEAKISGADQKARAMEQINAAAKEPATQRLLSTPLQVTILTALVQQMGRVPRERWNLFHEYFTYTYKREIERRSYASGLLNEHRSHIVQIHARVALLLQAEAERAGGVARMTRERLEQVISAVLEEDEVSPDQRRDLIRDIAHAAENRLVFLVEPEPGQFGFEIRSLQEFMAAWALTTGRDMEVEARLSHISGSSIFRNTLLFASSRLFSDGSPLRDVLAEKICKRLNSVENDGLSAATMAGSLLALDIMEEGAPLSQPKRARALISSACDILHMIPDENLTRLVANITPDTEPVVVAAIERRLLASDRSSIAAWISVIEGVNLDQKWAKIIADKYWNSTNSLPDVIDSMSRLDVELPNFIAEKIEREAPQIDPSLLIDLNIKFSNDNEATWISWIISSLGSSYKRRRIRDFPNVIEISDSRSYLKQPGYPPPSTKPWKAWITAAKFESNPSVTTLAAALSAIASNLTIDQWHKIASRASWPLGACLNAAKSVAELRFIAKLLKSGEFGNVDLWRSSQKKWGENLNIQKLLANFPENGLWTKDTIQEVPPAVLLTAWEVGATKIRNKALLNRTLSEVARIFKSSSNAAARGKLAEYAIAALGRSAEKLDYDDLPIEAWLSASGMGAPSLAGIRKFISPERWESMLDSFGADGGWLYPASVVVEALREKPHNSVLLRAVVAFIHMLGRHYANSANGGIDREDFPGIVADIKRGRPENVDAAANRALLLFCFNGIDTEEEFNALYRAIKTASSHDPEVWERLMAVVEVGFMDTEQSIKLLTLVLNEPGVPYSAARNAINHARDILARRPSNIVDSGVWIRLGLPAPYPYAAATIAGSIKKFIPDSPVSLDHIYLKDVGGFSELRLDFQHSDSAVGQWIVLVGPNGAGKSTVLRSIVLALRSTMFPDIWPRGVFTLPWKRINKEGEITTESSINLKLSDGRLFKSIFYENPTLRVEQYPQQESPRVLPVFAYGCRRGSALGGVARQVNLDGDDGPEIATLFDEGATLIHAETWLVSLEGDIKRSKKSAMIFSAVIQALKQFLDVHDIYVRDTKLWVVTKDAITLPFSALSDGYLTSAGWVIDMVARWVHLCDQHSIEVGGNLLTEMRGLALVDEIDLHLHPKWQMEIISRTKQLLPNMSFVVTTHNPITLVGAKPEEIWVFSKCEDNVKVRHGLEVPMLLSGGELYKKYFDIDEIFPHQIGVKLQRYSYLSGYALRSDEEEAEMLLLKDELSAAGINPQWEIVPRIQYTSM